MVDRYRALIARALHPTTRILVWMLFAAVASWTAPFALLALGIVALLLAPKAPFARLFSRSRWLLASLILIFGFATPGEPLAPQLGAFSPTAEGVMEGALHVWRLTFIMASLTLLVTSMAAHELLAGLFVCLRPLRSIGVPAECIAARLWLTLQYAQCSEKPVRWKEWVEHGFETEPPATLPMTLAIPGFRPGDAVFGAAAVMLAGVLLA